MVAGKETRCKAIPERVNLGILTAVGVVMLYLIRTNLSVAIVAMVEPIPALNTTYTKDVAPAHHKPYCISVHPAAEVNVTITEDTEIRSEDSYKVAEADEGEVDKGSDQLTLTSTEKGLVLGAFFYGYFVTNIPGGRMAELFGTKKVFGWSILISGLLTLLTPVAARTHYMLLIFLRLIVGLVQGIALPALNMMVARWIPPLERPRFMSFTYTSNNIGTIMSMTVCAVIVDELGWPAVFYISGGASLVWVMARFLLMHDSPDQHPRISDEEKNYILDAIKEGTTQDKPTRTPWLSMACSVPLWAITIAHIGFNFSNTLLLTQLPSYMDSILGFSITNNGLLSSLPFLSQFFGSCCSGLLGDWLITRGYVSVHTSRRIFTTVTLFLSAVVIVVVGYAGCNATLAVVLMCANCWFCGSVNTGHVANTQDLAPNFAGTVYGTVNGLAFILPMCAPVIVGVMTSGQTLQEWQAVFWLTGAVQVFTWLFFMIFSSTEIQPWNYRQQADPEEGEKKYEDGVDEIKGGAEKVPSVTNEKAGETID